jgi:hypothetical protein
VKSSHSIIDTEHILSTGQGYPAKFCVLAIAFSEGFALGQERLWQVEDQQDYFTTKTNAHTQPAAIKIECLSG